MLSRFLLVLALAGTLFALPLSPTLALSESQQDAAIASLQSAVAALQSTVSSQAATIAAQQKTINAQKSLLSGFSRVTDTTRADKKKGTELFLTGLNLHIVNGLNATTGNPDPSGAAQVNGLGNVVIGYNETRGSDSSGNSLDARTGSHNLILGVENNFTSFGGIVDGYTNTISNAYASVTGGGLNTASGVLASVSGGYRNTASGTYSLVDGGLGNTASGSTSSAVGGNDNLASEYLSCTFGGDINIASGLGAVAVAGGENTVTGKNGVICGGFAILNTDRYGFAAGGGYTVSSPGPGTFHSP